MATNSKSKKLIEKNSNTSRKEREPQNSNIVLEKTVSWSTESNISVITKKRSPKVIIQSESIEHRDESVCGDTKHQLLKFICLIVICIIILITFFISLKTYNMVNGLYSYMLVG